MLLLQLPCSGSIQNHLQSPPGISYSRDSQPKWFGIVPHRCFSVRTSSPPILKDTSFARSCYYLLTDMGDFSIALYLVYSPIHFLFCVPGFFFKRAVTDQTGAFRLVYAANFATVSGLCALFFVLYMCFGPLPISTSTRIGRYQSSYWSCRGDF